MEEQQEIIVNRTQLPLACPQKGLPYLHPRVFLSLKDGRAICPYCSKHYILQEDYDEK